MQRLEALLDEYIEATGIKGRMGFYDGKVARVEVTLE